MERNRTPGLIDLAGPDAAQQQSMLEVHAFTTPNSIKVPIALEEMGLDYRLVPVNLRRGEQKTDAFKAMNPNAKVPVLIDRSVPGEGDVILSESAAILVHLAEKTGQLLPKDGPNAARSSSNFSSTHPASVRRSCSHSRSRSRHRRNPRQKRGRWRRSIGRWACSTRFSSVTRMLLASSTASQTLPISGGYGVIRRLEWPSTNFRSSLAGTKRF